jgi:hypothetical protein
VNAEQGFELLQAVGFVHKHQAFGHPSAHHFFAQRAGLLLQQHKPSGRVFGGFRTQARSEYRVVTIADLTEIIERLQLLKRRLLVHAIEHGRENSEQMIPTVFQLERALEMATGDHKGNQFPQETAALCRCALESFFDPANAR